MKHLKFIIMMFMAANIALISSCKKDEDPDEPVNENPNINLAGDAGNIASDVTLEPGASIQVTITASENSTTKKNLTNLKIVRSANGTDNTVLDSALSAKTFGPFTATFSAVTNEATEKWTFTVTDKDGKVGTTSFTITTEFPVNTTPLATNKTGQFFHVAGSKKGAFDLSAAAEVAAAGDEATKDMKNTDKAGETFTGAWTTGTGNTTMYVKVSKTYSEISTVEAATAAYAAGSATNSVTPNTDDVFVVKLRGAEDYWVLHITSIDPANNDCNCTNKGKIAFEYKGK